MDGDKIFVLIVCTVYAAAIIGRLVYDSRATSSERLLFQLWQKSGLAMGPNALDTAPALRAQLARRRCALEYGALVGLTVAAIVSLLVPAINATSFVWFVVIPATALGGIASEVAVSIKDSVFHPAQGVPRIARIRQVRLRDYVSGWLLTLTAFFAMAAAAISLWSAALVHADGKGTDSTGWISSIVALGIALLIAVVAFVSTRFVLAQPQPASGTAELAWDDAMRATLLLRLWMFASVASALACAISVQGLAKVLEAESGSVDYGALSAFSFVIYAVPLGLFSMMWAFSHFRKQLWSDYNSTLIHPVIVSRGHHGN